MNEPFQTENAIDYAWQRLAERAGLRCEESAAETFASIGVTIHYSQEKDFSEQGHHIVVAPFPTASWQTVHNLEPNSLKWFSAHELLPSQVAFEINEPVPVLFWGSGYEEQTKPFVERRANGVVVFYADIIAATFFMLSRWEEYVATDFDAHQRFPAHNSVAYQQGFIEHPIVDYYGLILRAWLCEILPEWEPRTAQFTVQLSHDIDFVRRFHTPKQIAIAVAQSGFKRRNVKEIGRAHV